MSHKKVSAQVWSDLYPDQPPRPGLIILDAPAKGGGGHQYISCGGDEPKNLEKRARKLAALWNMAEEILEDLERPLTEDLPGRRERR